MHPLEADGETALRLAAYYKRLQVTELLLNHSANIYDRNEEDEAPIDEALGRPLRSCVVTCYRSPCRGCNISHSVFQST
jgi:ankyrin repeat protein